MNNCKEFILDDVMAVTAIPVSNPAQQTPFPGTAGWQLSPVIEAAAFSPSLANSIVIGRQPAVQNGDYVPIVPMTGKAKDDEGDATAGRLHTVTVSLQADDRDAETWGLLLRLERTPSHLVLTFRDGTRAFVQGTVDTYRCTVERDGAKTSVELRIQCLMGIQRIV